MQARTLTEVAPGTDTREDLLRHVPTDGRRQIATQAPHSAAASA
ncbi:hypothetical protein [Streptomyces hydrogenans]